MVTSIARELRLPRQTEGLPKRSINDSLYTEGINILFFRMFLS